ncbi:MAG: energy transducer TonB [Ferruginibacter sp.]
MNNNNKDIIYTARDIEQYLAGNLSPLQMHAMEKAALDDPFLAEAMEGYEGMKHTEWNNELVALRIQIADKGAVAKVIPLHKSKNNWWKAAAAVFILGAGTTLTFILNNNKKEAEKNPQIAQTIIAGKDSSLLALNEMPPSVTVSLNPSASATTAEKKAIPGSVVQLDQVKKADEKYIADPTAPQLKLVAPPISGTISNDDKTLASATPVNNNAAGATNNNGQLAEDAIASKSSPAGKASEDADILGRQKSDNVARAKKEASFNNFFTAQVVGTDNSPLPFTNISIKKENFGTYADARGIVRLVSTDSILNIEVRSVGYVPKTYALRNNQAQTKIVLQEEEVAQKDKMIIGNGNITNNQRSRRATLLTDSAVNVEPADGWDNYNTYVANNFDIPEERLNNILHGEVELSFDVKSNGTISNIRVNKSLGAEYDEAAKRLILEGPQWKVKKGKKTSASVKVQF